MVISLDRPALTKRLADLGIPLTFGDGKDTVDELLSLTVGLGERSPVQYSDDELYEAVGNMMDGWDYSQDW